MWSTTNRPLPRREDKPRTEFGRRLRALRDDLNLSQEDMCAALAVCSQSAFSGYERGAQLPPERFLAALIRKYGLPAEEWRELVAPPPIGDVPIIMRLGDLQQAIRVTMTEWRSPSLDELLDETQAQLSLENDRAKGATPEQIEAITEAIRRKAREKGMLEDP